MPKRLKKPKFGFALRESFDPWRKGAHGDIVAISRDCGNDWNIPSVLAVAREIAKTQETEQ